MLYDCPAVWTAIVCAHSSVQFPAQSSERTSGVAGGVGKME